MHSFTEVDTLFGNPPKPSSDGYAPLSIMASWAALSNSSVVTPGCAQVNRGIDKRPKDREPN